jgi:DNA-binding HxlR family transcriptional regulator
MESAPREPASCAAACPDLIRTALDVIAAKWAAPILVALATEQEPVRYAGLQRVIAVTPKELAKNLRALETAGVVRRRVHPTVPPSVDYALTELGRSLWPAIENLADWAAAAAIARP